MLTIPGNPPVISSVNYKKTKRLTTGNILRQLAFDHAAQANIITVTARDGKIIIVNSAACRLLGYSKTQLLTKSRENIFDINENNFKKMLKQRAADGFSTAMLTAIRKNGKQFPCAVTSAVFVDGHGIELAITTIADISQSIQKQKKIDTKNNRIVAANIVQAKSEQKKIDTKNEKIVSDNIDLARSEQKRIDTKNEKIVSDNIDLARSEQKKIDIKNEKIVAANIVQAKSEQKRIDIKNEKLVAANIVQAKSEQKKIDIKNEKLVAANIVQAKSAQKKIDTMNEKIVSDNIILAQAKSDARLAENKEQNKESAGKLLTEYQENFKFIFNSSCDVFYDVDLVVKEVVVSDAYEKEFGYKVIGNKTSTDDYGSHIHPDDSKSVMLDYQLMLASAETEWKYSFRFLRADHSVANVISSRVILRNAHGKAYRIIGSMQDISKQKVLEEKLEHEIKLKEKQITEATEEAKDAERSDIGRELHDNVNQLLSASKLYLEMAKRGGTDSEVYLARSSEYTLEAIEAIRKLSKVLTTDIIKDFGLCEAIENIAWDTMKLNLVKISCSLDSFVEDSVNNKFKLNVYRIIQEQLNNILKHANAKEVNISLLQNKRSIILAVADNGIGFDTEKRQKGIGIDNIKSRAVSYNGMAEFVSQPGHGCVLTVRFPLTGITAK